MYETAEQLMQSDEFLGFCGAWERDRWCPAPFADWCLENVGELAFQAAMWAVETPEREDFPDRRPARVCPTIEGGDNKERGQFYWMGITTGTLANDYVPIRGAHSEHLLTFAAAVAYYLINFDVELAAKFPPKRMATLA